MKETAILADQIIDNTGNVLKQDITETIAAENEHVDSRIDKLQL